ncbi:nicotinate [Sesbania bispinosa]|nr:nicotinate [Sesbania bispinosa]
MEPSFYQKSHLEIKKINDSAEHLERDATVKELEIGQENPDFLDILYFRRWAFTLRPVFEVAALFAVLGISSLRTTRRWSLGMSFSHGIPVVVVQFANGLSQEVEAMKGASDQSQGHGCYGASSSFWLDMCERGSSDVLILSMLSDFFKSKVRDM